MWGANALRAGWAKPQAVATELKTKRLDTRTPQQKAADTAAWLSQQDCYNCYVKGHLARDCPQPRRIKAAKVNNMESALIVAPGAGESGKADGEQ
jgi:hypothetical protein